MIEAREQKRQILDACAGPLEELGFRRQQTNLFVRDLTDDIYGGVALGLHVYRDPDRRLISVTPNVGVRSDSLHRLLSKINGEKYHRYVPKFTLSRLLGNLLPFHGQSAWSFMEPGDPPKEKAGRMVMLIGRYGLPFMQDLSSLSSIHNALATHPFRNTGGFLERIPTAMLLTEGRAAARGWVVETLERFADDSTMLAEHYRAFARRFLAYTDQPRS